MDSLPDKCGLNTPEQPLQLLDSEGLSAGRAFLYYAPWKLLAIQRNKNGPSIGEIENYFHSVFNLTDFVELKLVLQPDSYHRLRSMQEVRTFEVRFAGVKNASILKGGGHGVEKLIDLLEFFHAPSATISMSVGNAKDASLSLDLKRIGERLGILNTEHPKQIKKVELLGVDDEGKRKFVNLLLDPFLYKLKVSTEARRLPYTLRRGVVSRGFSELKHDLGRILAPSGS
jgi:hypothetical protein